MSDNQIDNRDQEVISKYRSVVYGKERQKKKKKIRIGLLGGSLLACCVVLLIAVFYFSGEKRPDTATYYSERASFDKINKSGSPSPPDSEQKSVKTKQESKLPANEEKVAEKSPISVDTLTPENKTPIQNNINRTNSLNQPLKSVTAETAETAVTDEAAKATEPEQKSPGGIRIARLVPCLQVKDRQYISPQTEFSIETDGRPDVWVWMDVRSEKNKLPYTLRHVYFFNNRKYASVTLNIRYPRMRTWSNLTLENDKYAGKWRVEVVTENGQKISRADFTVVP